MLLIFEAYLRIYEGKFTRILSWNFASILFVRIKKIW